LIQRNFEDAAQLYAQAVAMAPGRTGDHASTCKQARRLLEHLSPMPPDAARVLAVFRRVVHTEDAASA
jgi:hypothetical protein